MKNSIGLSRGTSCKVANFTKIADLTKNCESDHKHEKPAKIYLANIQIGWLNFEDGDFTTMKNLCSAETENCGRISMFKSLGPFRISKPLEPLLPLHRSLKLDCIDPIFNCYAKLTFDTIGFSVTRHFFSFVHLLKVLASFINKHHSTDNLQLHNDTTSCPFRFRYMF